MADVLIAISGHSIQNGRVLVTNSTFPLSGNNTINPKVNQTAQFTTQSGILDSRFDDVRYYEGDTAL